MLDKRARFGIKPEPIKKIVRNDFFSLREEFSTAYKNFQKRPVVSCKFSEGMNCCRVCNMGPCQVREGFEEFKGICGASAATVVGRNFSRMVVSGASAHSEHARDILLTLAKKVENGFEIKNKKILKSWAKVLNINSDLSEKEILSQMIEKIFKIFGQSEGRVLIADLAPDSLKEKWENYKVFPRGINKEIVELFHKTTIGVDQEYKNIFKGAIRTSLADGWGSSLVATTLRDFVFDFSKPVEIKVNVGLSWVDPEKINISVYETDPSLTEALIEASSDEEILKLVKRSKAKGINFTNVFNNIPLIGSFIQQEVSLGTGLIEAIVIGSTCVSPNLVELAKQYHSLIIVTDKRCNLEGATYIEFDRTNSLEIAKEILKLAISRFKLRDKSKIRIPEKSFDVKIGFRASNVDINYIKEKIAEKEILGVVFLLGCDTPYLGEPPQIKIAKELIKNNILVLVAGCTATSLAMSGLLSVEGLDFAGEGLKKALEKIEAPPLWYLGSCIDVPQIFEFLKEGLPIVAGIPEWMSESMVSIAMYLSCSGIPVVLGSELPTRGSKKVTDFLSKEMKNLFGGFWLGSKDYEEFVKNILSLFKN